MFFIYLIHKLLFMRKHYTFLVLLFTVFISNAQIVNIPDANFKVKLLAASPSNGIARNSSLQNIKIDINNDGEIQVSEALPVYHLNVASSSIQNLTGIEAFSSLRSLNCSSNQLINLDVTQNIFLQFLSCDSNQLINLDVSQNTILSSLYCENNQLENLVLPISTTLTDINCSYNQLENISISQCSSLQNFNCHNNNLTSIDISQTQSLFDIDCSFNQLTFLDLSNNPLLSTIFCNNNLITSIQISINGYPFTLFCNNNLIEFFDMNNARVSYINLSNNPNLVSMNVKNNQSDNIFINNTPSLQYICVDEQELSTLESIFNNADLSNIEINSYCSFEPGGTFYTIQGNNKFDSNSNGCDANDIVFPNQKFTITNGSISGTIIADQSGTYSIPVQSGSHTITPVFENPSYFTVSPASATVSFPATASPATRNFCITANGVKNDLEVTIIPLAVARPGFDAHYRIIYKNKGNQVANGSLSFTFDDAIMDLVSVTPVNDYATTNSLSWNYANLIPLETREIDLIFNINSPMETPAVNGGDVLDYTATIVGATDQTPNDNTFTLNQTVVNSYDPNDKTCLEGATITPSMVGQYVHYVIRFENTGTFAAENIVVKDMIDTTKFDVSTLIPQHSSHDFFTRINGNKVEFIFENINLPFDDANNDGYVAFKIKTKPTLVLGNTFTNSASIYFDYNFPIVTDPAVTTVALLNTNDFDFGTYFTLYPNPAKDVLNFEVQNEIGVKSVSVYNTLGQIVMAITNIDNLKSIDVSRLTAGSYFVKVYTDKGSSSSKFIKQ
ncbi:MAG: T9SS C-terminal target domain-containing protein [Flavobacteriaceae bacterium]|nr:MAG: T9SS C-terminal target domain-containing protein [Flavobacteriaceae bacterium]